MDRVFHDGDTLTVKTAEGVDMMFRVLSVDEKVCEVCGIDGKPSIDITTVGAVTIPSKAGEFTVTNISYGAFVGCDKMTAINIPESVTVISPFAFYGCTGLASISVSEDNMFYDSRNGCNALIETETSTLLLGCANTVIPSSVTTIGESAFEGCKTLAAINIPSSVSSIGALAFRGCSTLASITLPKGVTSIADKTFYDCKALASVNIPSSVVSIGDSAFVNCMALSSIILPQSLNSIGKGAFQRCTELASIELPASLVSLGNGAFFNCWSLCKVVSLIENPFPIDDNVFSGIPNNAVLYVPQGTKEKYNETKGWKNAFAKIVAEGDPEYGDGDYFLAKVNGIEMSFQVINYGEKTCRVRAENDESAINEATTGSIAVPSQVNGFTVIAIGVSAFARCNKLTSVSLPEELTTIEDKAFFDCQSLTSVNIPVSVTSIGTWAFLNCKALTSIVLPESLNTIGSYAFQGCRGLTSFEIPANVTSIGESVLFSCYNLKEVTTLIENPFTIQDNVFSGIPKDVVLYVPRGTKVKYERASGWSGHFAKIVEIGASEYQDGDVNMDGSVNGTDLVALANIILGKQAETESADVNKDGSVNGTDIVSLSNIILRRNNAKRRAAVKASNSLSIEDFNIKAGEEADMLIDLNNANMDVTLVQFDLHLPKGLSIKQTGGDLDIDMADRTTWRKHTLDANTKGDITRFLLYSGSNALISGNSGAIIKVRLVADGTFNGEDITIDNALLVSPDQTEVKPEAYTYQIGGSVVPTPTNAQLAIEPFDIKAGEEADMLIDLNNANMDVTLVQFDLHLPKGLSIKLVGGELDIDMADRTTWRKHTLDANTMGDFTRFLLYSGSNALISGNSGAIIKVKLIADDAYKGGDIVIDNTLIVTPEQKEVKPDKYVYTGIEGMMMTESPSHSTIYNLSGQRLEKPSKGINIIEGKKVVVK